MRPCSPCCPPLAQPHPHQRRAHISEGVHNTSPSPAAHPPRGPPASLARGCPAVRHRPALPLLQPLPLLPLLLLSLLLLSLLLLLLMLKGN